MLTTASFHVRGSKTGCHGPATYGASLLRTPTTEAVRSADGHAAASPRVLRVPQPTAEDAAHWPTRAAGASELSASRVGTSGTVTSSATPRPCALADTSDKE
jgi:hypothetical protein